MRRDTKTKGRCVTDPAQVPVARLSRRFDQRAIAGIGQGIKRGLTLRPGWAVMRRGAIWLMGPRHQQPVHGSAQASTLQQIGRWALGPEGVTVMTYRRGDENRAWRSARHSCGMSAVQGPASAAPTGGPSNHSLGGYRPMPPGRGGDPECTPGFARTACWRPKGVLSHARTGLLPWTWLWPCLRYTL